MAILKEKGISSHSYTPDQNKQVSLILRGIHLLTPLDDIKNELEHALPNTIESVQNFITPHMRKNNIKSNLFRVTLKPGHDAKELLNIKYLLFQTVMWEKPKFFSKHLQCKRCQKWGHIAKNCNHPYSCVKCNENHGPGECKLQMSTDSKPFCINCKQWGHPANFRGCDSYRAFSAARSTRAVATTTPRSRFANNEAMFSTPKNSLVNPNISYASLLKRPSQTPNMFKNAKLLEDFIKIANQILIEDEPISIEVQIEHFLKNFRSMSPDVRKAECRKLLEQLK